MLQKCHIYTFKKAIWLLKFFKIINNHIVVGRGWWELQARGLLGTGGLLPASNVSFSLYFFLWCYNLRMSSPWGDNDDITWEWALLWVTMMILPENELSCQWQWWYYLRLSSPVGDNDDITREWALLWVKMMIYYLRVSSPVGDNDDITWEWVPVGDNDDITWE